jgi:SAM-dependent methyltransferase
MNLWSLPGWIDHVMCRRAAALTERIRRHVQVRSRVADIGSGTGHNARTWRKVLGVTVDEYDVADLHWVGPGPILYDGFRLPVEDSTYDTITLLFVLQYVEDPLLLLQEIRRTCRRHVLVIQSTYRGDWGRICLAAREFVWGRAAFCVARLAPVVRPQSCPLHPRTMFTQERLARLFGQAGYSIRTWESQAWHGMNISRDLYLLEPTHAPWMFPSSSLPAMKSAG